jgi:hypothetical protein
MTKHNATSLRLQLLARGYAVLPCHGKVPAIHGWNAVNYIADQISDGPRGTREARITSWERRFSRAVTSGVRIENGLLVIDIDVDDEQMVSEIYSTIAAVAPEVWSRAPTRFGGGDKVAIFCRVEGEAFTRIASRKYRRPKDGPEKYHAVEIFGGKPFRSGVCSRQFAVYGPRAYDEKGEIASEYRWDPDLPSLHDVDLTNLPILSKEQAYAIAHQFEALAERHGWVRVTDLDEGDGEARDIYDIDRDLSRFEVYGGEEVSYAELEALALAQDDLRVSANFIAGENSTTPDRCSVYWSDRHDCAVVKDWKTAARHYPADLASAGPEAEGVAEAIRGVAEDAGVDLPISEPNWCETYENGRPRPSLRNARLGIVAAGIVCSLDTFHNRMWMGRSDAASPRERLRPFMGVVTDRTIGGLRVFLANAYDRDFTEAHVYNAVYTLATENSFNPVVDMLAEAEASWDGVPRLDRMAVDYFNCADTEVNRACVRKTMIAAVARARTPGCKFDTILVMESKEGWNKSSAWAVLAGEGNFSDERVMGQASREVQEDLAGMGKAEVEAVKAFASRQVDRARPAYGKVLVEQPRHSIEIGTTNARRYLISATGNRRFWPVEILAPIDLARLRAARLQLWGEAAHYQSRGEVLTLEERLWGVIGEVQEDRRVRHPWEELLATIVAVVDDSPTSGSGTIGAVIAHRVLDEERVPTRLIFEHLLKVPHGQMHNGHSKTIADIMRLQGWQHGVFKYQGVTVKGYVRTIKP